MAKQRSIAAECIDAALQPSVEKEKRLAQEIVKLKAERDRLREAIQTEAPIIQQGIDDMASHAEGLWAYAHHMEAALDRLLSLVKEEMDESR